MSGAAIRRPPFPRAPLFAAAFLVGSALAAAAVSRFTGPMATVPPSHPVLTRDLLFEDQANGGVDVLDARNRALLYVAEPGTNGFLRATLRGLARERIHQDIGPQTPFRLTGWADGRLTLEDPTTHRAVEMEAFGETNEGVFAHILTAPEPSKP